MKFSAEIPTIDKEKKPKLLVKLSNTPNLNQSFKPQSFNRTYPSFSSTSNEIPKEFFNKPPPPLHKRPPNISNDRNIAENIMFAKNRLEASQNMVYMPNQTPQPMLSNNININQNMLSGNIYNMPTPPINPTHIPPKSNIQMQQQPLSASLQQIPQQRQFNNTWNSETTNTGKYVIYFVRHVNNKSYLLL